ncbi:NHL repeat-containing protein [Stieleria varia]|uniref:NHL repeat protein n=1 Tax=Stieleria varia TaxID=2528005 RepID=A0A5C6AZV6_9BACT|nr:hypothetical protein [Stieleria varia]TWU05565.1 NHL repeat protein [Stieleria varia]
MNSTPTQTLLSLVVVLGALTSVTSMTSWADDDKTDRVRFVVGDYLTSENGNWDFTSSPLQEPFGIDFDDSDAMYIVELTSGALHKRSADGNLQTLRDKHEQAYVGDGGPVDKASFNGPHNCVVSANGQLLIADSWNHCVRSMDLKTRKVQTIVGVPRAGFSGDGGRATDAQFDFIMCIALSPDRQRLHIADLKNRRIRDVDLSTGNVTTIAGNGKKDVPIDGAVATESPLVDPRAVCSDTLGNVYVLERNGNALRVVRPDGTIHTVAGNGKKGYVDGEALQAQFGEPKHLCCDPEGNVYIADDRNGAIRKYSPSSGQVTTILGQGNGDPRITLLRPHGVRWHNSQLYIVDTGHNRILSLPQ